MNSTSKTLYLTLYAKAMASKQGIILDDPKAEAIWEDQAFDIGDSGKAKMNAYYTAMRAAVFDRWTLRQLRRHPDAIVIHIGCGLDARIDRIGRATGQWFDIDFPEVIAERRKYFEESDTYKMIEADATSLDWLAHLPDAHSAIVILEGVYMYMPRTDFERLGIALSEKYPSIALALDSYREWLVRKVQTSTKHPIHAVGATIITGLDNPETLGERIQIPYLGQVLVCAPALLRQLPLTDRVQMQIFKTVFNTEHTYGLHQFQRDA